MGQNSVFAPTWGGIGFAVLALLGLALGLRRQAALPTLMVLAGLGASLVMMGAGKGFFFSRHVLPLTPLSALLVGLGLANLAWLLGRMMQTRGGQGKAALLTAVIAVAATAPEAIGSYREARAAQEVGDPRNTMSEYLLASLPEGTTVTVLAETRWYTRPAELKRFHLKSATIPQMMHSPAGTTDTAYFLAPLAVELGGNSPLRDSMEQRMNQWLARVTPVQSFGQPAEKSCFGAPPGGIAVQLIRNTDDLASSRTVPQDAIWGSSFEPPAQQEDSAVLADGPLALHSGFAVTAPVRLTGPKKSLVLAARGLSPVAQENPPVVGIDVAATSDTAFARPLLRAELSLIRSQGGMNEYSAATSLPPGDYIVRLRPQDADGFVILVESLSFL